MTQPTTCICGSRHYGEPGLLARLEKEWELERAERRLVAWWKAREGAHPEAFGSEEAGR